jgi:hypothetical protein
MGWKGKLICILVIYFAGFATAIYCLAPVPEDQAVYYDQKGFPYTAVKSDQFAKSFNVSLHKGINYTKDIASRTVDYLKQRANEKPNNSPSAQSASLNR